MMLQTIFVKNCSKKMKKIWILSTHLSPFEIFPKRSIHSNLKLNQRIGIIGAPFNKGQRKLGVEEGPRALRETNFIENLRSLGHTVHDYGDIIVENGSTDYGIVGECIRNCSAVATTNKKLSESVKEILLDKLCLTLGGDHSIAIGSIHGHAQVNPDLCLLWIDAHTDINTATTTRSGNMHGMSASFHIRELEHFNLSVKDMHWLKPSLSGKDIAYIGLRDVEPLERLIVEKLGIKTFCLETIDKLGIVEVVARALESINPTGKKKLHVSFDVDSLDVTVAPSTGTPVPGGLTLREGLRAAEEIHASGLMHALDIVEVNPKIGTQQDVHKTVHSAKEVLLGFFGSQRRGNIPLDITEIPEKIMMEKLLY